jgi:hypothetical protein
MSCLTVGDDKSRVTCFYMLFMNSVGKFSESQKHKVKSISTKHLAGGLNEYDKKMETNAVDQFIFLKQLE